MTLLSSSGNTPPPALPDASRRDTDCNREPHDTSSALPGKFCLRCCGLLIPSYTASLERDATGKPMRLWRCVNCGDCVNSEILANRWKNPEPIRQRARPPIGPQYTGAQRGTRAGLARGQ
jgi:hypothetical protein